MRQLHVSGLLVSKERVDIHTAYPVSSAPLIKTVTTIRTAKKWRKKTKEHKPPEKYTTRLSTFVETLSKRNSSAPTKRRTLQPDEHGRDQFRNCRLNSNMAPSRVSYNGQLMSARYELSDASISTISASTIDPTHSQVMINSDVEENALTRSKTAPVIKVVKTSPREETEQPLRQQRQRPKTSGPSKAPKVPDALFFTYSDGQMIPGREQIYIKGRMRERHAQLVAEIPKNHEQRKTYK